MQFSEDDFSRIPIWIKLHHVSLEYWTNKGLSYVAGALGVPLHADVTTLMHKCLTYTRVCVVIDASKMLVKEFDLQYPYGMVITISAEYEWLPSGCSSCNVFGHNLTTCPSNHNDKAPMMGEAKMKKGGVGGTASEYNLHNKFQWQEVGNRKKDNQKTMPSCSSTGEGTQVLNKEGNQVVYCIMNCTSRETMNIQRSTCDTLP